MAMSQEVWWMEGCGSSVAVCDGCSAQAVIAPGSFCLKGRGIRYFCARKLDGVMTWLLRSNRSSLMLPTDVW